MLTRNQKYKAYVANARAISSGIDHIYLQIKSAIKSNQNSIAESLFKVMLTQVAILAEVKLLKLLHEDDGFTDADITDILGKDSHLGKWECCVRKAFCKRYNVEEDRLNTPYIPFDAAARLEEILRILREDFEPFILLRNKLSHGQWVRCFNTYHTEFENRTMQIMSTENALTLNHKMKMLSALRHIIHDLVVSDVAFDRDFDKYYADMINRQEEVERVDYEKWCQEMRDKYLAGRLKMAQNIAVAN